MGRFRKDGQTDLRVIPEVRYRPLGREGADGLASHVLMGDVVSSPVIEVDSGLTGILRLETELHEGLHLVFPALPEGLILKAGRYLSRLLWKIGYRLH